PRRLKRKGAARLSALPSQAGRWRGRLESYRDLAGHAVAPVHAGNDPAGGGPPARVASGPRFIDGHQPRREVWFRIRLGHQSGTEVKEHEIQILVKGLKRAVPFLADPQRPILFAQPDIDGQFAKKRLPVPTRS